MPWEQQPLEVEASRKHLDLLGEASRSPTACNRSGSSGSSNFAAAGWYSWRIYMTQTSGVSAAVPKWVSAARNLRTSASLICRALRALNAVKTSL